MTTEPRPTPGSRPRWTAGRIVLIVLGSLGVLLGAGLLAAGIGLTWADQTQRDRDGFLSTPTERYSSDSFAIVSEPIDLVTAETGGESVLSDDVLGQTRVRVDGDDVFVGVGPTSQVEAYLSGVEHDVLKDVQYGPFDADYDRTAGGSPSGAPGDQGFWAESVSGSGEQVLTWQPESGTWSVVVMNSDGDRGIAAAVSVGAEADALTWLGIGILIAGAVLLLGGSAMIYFGARRRPGEMHATSAEPVPHGRQAPTVYPVAVTGELAPTLSRWLWLVKWILLIPHFIVLAFLWIAFTVLTLVAGISILFTRRYPHGIFEFNVGVLRWTWRVWFYGYWANGTDRYPPFTLGEAPDYPAQLEVVYPALLNRWLPLVKWLLAIPHLLLVAVFVGGWGWGPISDEWRGWGFAGLVGLLVIIACVVLLFTGRYPPALFDFALGLDRWALRVGAYVGLMTDDYPPFRLDLGSHEPEGRETASAPAATPS